MVDLIYQEFEPTAALMPFVHCLWRFSQEEPTRSEVIVPDGRPELIIHLGTPYTESATGCRQPKILFAGQLTKPLELCSELGSEFWAVRFRPDGAREFLGCSVSYATDRRVDLEKQGHTPLRGLASRLALPQAPEAAVLDICDTLVEQIGPTQPDRLVRSVVDAVMAGEAFESALEVSDRQFQRRFKAEVGVSLRTFKAIRRFRSVFDRMQRHEEENWVQRALATGYFDQPQMARDFKRFLGRSARAWIKDTGALSESLSTSED